MYNFKYIYIIIQDLLYHQVYIIYYYIIRYKNLLTNSDELI